MTSSFNNFILHLRAKWVLLIGGVLNYALTHALQGLLLCWGIAVLLSLIDCYHDTKECQKVSE